MPGLSYVDYPDLKQKESYYEINGGLALSMLFQIGQGMTCTPYGGVMISRLDGDEHYELTYHVQERTTEQSGDIRNDGALSFFAGLGMTFANTWGMRIEGRFMNQSSVSAGLFCFF